MVRLSKFKLQKESNLQLGADTVPHTKKGWLAGQ